MASMIKLHLIRVVMTLQSETDNFKMNNNTSMIWLMQQQSDNKKKKMI